MKLTHKALFAGLLTSAVMLGLAAHADDWSQFRHDAGHSAVSADKLAFPLKEEWTWDKRNTDGSTPLYHATIWKGRIYFTGSEGNNRLLVCADAHTGKINWSKPLAATHLRFAISEIVGPAVTSGGTVFVYDWFTQEGVRSRTGMIHHGQATSSAGQVEPINSFCVRTFNALTGEEGSFFPLAAMGANGVLPRLSLIEGVRGQEVRPVPATMVGCPP